MGNNQMKQHKISLLIIVIGCVMVILGCVLPFYTVNYMGVTASVKYIEVDGIIVCICAIVAAILAFLKLKKVAIVPSAIGLVLTVVELIAAQDAIGALGSLNIGAYLVVLGAIVAVVGSVLAFVWRLSRK